MQLDKDFIKKVLPKVEFFGAEFNQNSTFSLDSRTIKKGDIFVALVGENCDGHDYIDQAFQRGARGVLIAQNKREILVNFEKKIIENKSCIIVEDPRQALIKLASSWRMQFTGPVIGITGSVGKTTTKEMIGNILSVNGTNYLLSSENQNTMLGVCLTLLRLRSEHKAAIIEMGVSRRGEMALMAEVVKPTSAVITCLGHSHMEGLGSLGDIANEKRTIFKFFKEDNIGIIYGDQSTLSEVAYTHPIIKFGCKTTNQIQARKIQITHDRTSFILKVYKDRARVELSTSHEGRVLNALAAASVGHLLGIQIQTIVTGIQKNLTVSRRFERRALRSNKGILIDDAYNANPESMKAALLALERVDSRGAKIAVLGDMLELGVNSPFWHRQLGRFLRKVPSLNHVILVGSLVKWTKGTVPNGITVDVVPSWQQAIKKVDEHLKQDSVVLVKGSLGMNLQGLVEAISDKK